MKSLGKKQKGALAIALITLVALFALIKGGVFPLMETPGFLTGAQGLEAQFHSLYWERNWYSTTECPSGKKPSMRQFGFTMTFDPDDQYDGWADLCASQQPFTVDTEVEPKHYAWTVDKGTVTLSNGTKVKKVYQFEMWRYRMTWAVNIWMSGTEAETCDTTAFNIITWYPNYADTTLWIKIMPKNYPYFKDNPDQLFLAPAYIGLENIAFAAFDQDKREIKNDPDIQALVDLIPKAPGEALGIYYQRGGTPINLEQRLLAYQGAELDPAIFRNEYWTRITLLNFPVKTWFDWQIWHKWKFPSVYLKFVVYAFVVGRWTVYLASEEVPQLTPHTPPTWTRDPISDFLKAVGDWFGKNWVWLLLVGLAVIAIIVFVLTLPKRAAATVVVGAAKT